jgi:hypothetical protein
MLNASAIRISSGMTKPTDVDAVFPRVAMIVLASDV